METCTAVLPVDAIEPDLPFWERFGFAKVAEVPHGDRLGFVILVLGQAQVMLQTHASLAEDDAALAGAVGGATLLYVRVPDLDAVIARLGDAPVLVAERRTFYGAREIGVRTPGGHVVLFSAAVE